MSNNTIEKLKISEKECPHPKDKIIIERAGDPCSPTMFRCKQCQSVKFSLAQFEEEKA